MLICVGLIFPFSSPSFLKKDSSLTMNGNLIVTLDKKKRSIIEKEREGEKEKISNKGVKEGQVKR